MRNCWGMIGIARLSDLNDLSPGGILRSLPMTTGEDRVSQDGSAPPNEPSGFLSTVWSRIERAKGGDAAARDQIYLQYRRPVERFLERRLPQAADVEALADDVMMTVLDRNFLQGAERAKGRFRDLLLAVTRHRMNNYARWLRAGRRDYRRAMKFDDVLDQQPATEEEKLDFDRLYADEILRTAIERLRKDSEEKSSLEAQVVHLFYMEGFTQAEVAERLCLTVAGVNTHLSRGRKRLKEHLFSILATVSRDADELEQEAKHLLQILARRRR